MRTIKLLENKDNHDQGLTALYLIKIAREI